MVLKMIKGEFLFIFIYMSCNGGKAIEGRKDQLLDVEVTIIQETSFRRILSLACKSVHAPIACAVEFKINEKTIDNLRFQNNFCYHGTGVCDPGSCSCSTDCKTFRLNYTDYTNDKTFNFGCLARFQDTKEYFQKKEVLKLFNGTGSYIIRDVEAEEDDDNTPDRNIKPGQTPVPCEKGNCWPWIISTAAVTVVLSVFAFIIAKQSLKKKTSKKSARSQVNRNERPITLEIIQETNEDSTSESPVNESSQLLGQTDEAVEDINTDIIEVNSKVELCNTCKRAPSSICADCEKRFCVMCCAVHKKYFETHVMCQIYFAFPEESEIKCKMCMKKTGSKICYLCNKICCLNCIKKHQHGVNMMLSIGKTFDRRVTV